METHMKSIAKRKAVQKAPIVAKKKGHGGPPSDLCQAMLAEGFMHRPAVAKLIQRSLNWFTGKKIEHRGQWYVFLKMADVAKVLGPELSKMRGLTPETKFGCAA